MKSILISMIFITIVSSVNIEVASSFMADTFSDADGWAFKSGAVGFDTRDGKSIIGGLNNLGDQNILFKTIYVNTPHQILRISFTLWAIGLWDAGHIIVNLDQTELVKISISSEQIVNFEKSYQYSVASNENSNTYTLFFYMKGYSADKGSFGIRDFQAFAVPCPSGCVTCSKGEKAELCGIWSLAASYFSTQAKADFTNEGWTTAGVMNFDNCLQISYIGGFNQRNGIEKVLLLDPHYKLKIKFFLIKIDFWGSTYLQVDLDGVQIINQDVKDEYTFTSTCGSNTYEESYLKINEKVDHFSQFAKLKIAATISEANPVGFSGYRDLEIFIAKCAATCKVCTGPSMAECTSTGAAISFTSFEQNFQAATFTDLENWNIVQDQTSTQISTCQSNSLIGGYSILGKDQFVEKYVQLPSHKVIRLSVTLYQIDSFENEDILITFDGVQKFTQSYTASDVYIDQLCGDPAQTSAGDSLTEVDINFAHTAPSTLIQIKSTLNEANTNGKYLTDCFKNPMVSGIQSYIQDNVYQLVEPALMMARHVRLCIQRFWSNTQTFVDDFSWNISSQLTTTTAACNSKSLIGSPAILKKDMRIYKVFTLPAHTKIKILAKIYIIDTWNDEAFIMTVDEVVIISTKFNSLKNNQVLCGNSASNDIIFEIDQIVDHNSLMAKIQFSSKLDSADALKSWGLREFEILYY